MRFSVYILVTFILPAALVRAEMPSLSQSDHTPSESEESQASQKVDEVPLSKTSPQSASPVSTAAGTLARDAAVTAIRDSGEAEDLITFINRENLVRQMRSEIKTLEKHKASPDEDYRKSLLDRMGKIEEVMFKFEKSEQFKNDKEAAEQTVRTRQELYSLRTALVGMRKNKENKFTEEQGMEALVEDVQALIRAYDIASAYLTPEKESEFKNLLAEMKARLHEIKAGGKTSNKMVQSIEAGIAAVEGLLAKADRPPQTGLAYNKPGTQSIESPSKAEASGESKLQFEDGKRFLNLTDSEIAPLPISAESSSKYGGASNYKDAAEYLTKLDPQNPITPRQLAEMNNIVAPQAPTQLATAPKQEIPTATKPREIINDSVKPDPAPTETLPPEATGAVAIAPSSDTTKTPAASVVTPPKEAIKTDPTSAPITKAGDTNTPPANELARAKPSASTMPGNTPDLSSTPSSSKPSAKLSPSILTQSTNENITAATGAGGNHGAGGASGGLTAANLLFPSMGAIASGAIAGGATAIGAAINVLANGNSREKADGARKSLSDLDAKHPGVSDNLAQAPSDGVFSWRKMKKMAGDAVAKAGDFVARVFGTSTGKSSATGTALASSSGGGASYSGASGGVSDAKKDTFSVADSGYRPGFVGEVPGVNPKTDVTFKPLFDATASLVFGNGVANLAKGINEINDVIEATTKEEALASAKGDAEFSNEDGTLKKGILQELYETEVLTSARALRDWFTPDREPASASASASKDVFRAAAIDAGNALPKPPPGKTKDWYQRFLEYVKAKLGIQDPNAKIAPVSVANK